MLFCSQSNDLKENQECNSGALLKYMVRNPFVLMFDCELLFFQYDCLIKDKKHTGNRTGLSYYG